MEIKNKILIGNAFETLRMVPKKSVHGCGTSPPYLGVRDYSTEPVIFDGSPGCQHDFTVQVEPGRHWTPGDKPSAISILANQGKERGASELRPGKASYFCSKCGAWRGNLGQEPSADLYIKHLADAFDLVKECLADWSILYVNLGDTYSGSGGAGGDWNDGKRAEEPKWKQPDLGLPDKCLVGIPARFELKMIERGWILRNVIIWYKRSCMPESQHDRFTIDYESVFLFVKNTGNPLFYVNEVNGLASKESPPKPGMGIEGQDWNWKDCKKCDGKGFYFECSQRSHAENERPVLVHEEQRKLQAFDGNDHAGWWCEECELYVEDGIEVQCSCEKGKVRESNWTGFDYYFNQLREPIKESTRKRCGKPISYGGVLKSGGDTAGAYTKATYRGAAIYDVDHHDGKRIMRCVWDVPVKGFRGKHFAVFPPELARRFIESGCPRYVCSKCGLPRVPIPNRKDGSLSNCGCNAPFDNGLWLDVFMGSGTSGMVALKEGRDFLGCELNSEYARIALARIHSRGKKIKVGQGERIKLNTRLEDF